MAIKSMMSARWRDWVTLVLAAWLLISPWAQGYAESQIPAWNAWAIGMIIAALSIWAIVQFTEWHDWGNGVLGLWLVVASWVLGYGQMAVVAWSHVAVGILVIIAAAWELWDESHGGNKAAA